jgi:hypothetical protein
MSSLSCHGAAIVLLALDEGQTPMSVDAHAGHIIELERNGLAARHCSNHHFNHAFITEEGRKVAKQMLATMYKSLY